MRKAETYDEMAGKWELQGGKINKNENREESLEREILEETGLIASALEDVARVEVEAKKCVNCYIMHSKNFTGEVQLSEEHSEYRWVTPDEFRNMGWHRDAGYGLPPMAFLDEYLGKESGY